MIVERRGRREKPREEEWRRRIDKRRKRRIL